LVEFFGRHGVGLSLVSGLSKHLVTAEVKSAAAQFLVNFLPQAFLAKATSPRNLDQTKSDLQELFIAGCNLHLSLIFIN
jgi:DNA gyrase/topoisomerase IV subunit B